MSTLLAKHVHTLITMDAQNRQLSDAALFVRDGVIEALGPLETMPPDAQDADTVLDLRHHVVVPGLVNTHHHMFQNLTRVFAQDQELFGWLSTLYPVWRHVTAEMVYVSAQVAIAELLLSGCTTSSDHLYLYVNDIRIDDEIRAAQEIGFRFHPTRGSMSVGESLGGLPPDSVVEDETRILKATQRAIETFHDNSRFSMLRIGIAPAAPFNVSQDLMRESAAMARSYPGVRLHTHLAENVRDIDYSLEHYHMRPGEYAESLGWVGEDVWHAHAVQLNGAEIDLFARTGTGVAHCPHSNMRLASGIAPIRAMLDARVKVGLGVDGAASNDSGHLLAEARQAMLLQRVQHQDPSVLSAQESLELATLGGAAVLGRDDIGALAVGMAADFAAFRLDTLSMAGAVHDPLAALVFTQPAQADVTVVNGRVLVRDGHLVAMDLPLLLERHAVLSRQLIDQAP